MLSIRDLQVAYLEHILAHSVVKFVLQRLVFKVELNLVTVIFAVLSLQLNDVEKNFNRAFWDRFCGVRLRKLNLIPTHSFMLAKLTARYSRTPRRRKLSLCRPLTTHSR